MFIEGSEEIELLNSLGLTSSEAKIIVTLWRLGVASANQIAQVSGVAREAIYQIMPKLQEKSLIEEVITIPKKFKALPMQEVYAILLHRKYKENQELCKKVSNLICKRRKEDSLVYNGGHEIVLVPTGGNEHFRITQQYEKVQKSVELTFTAGKFLQWSQYYAEWSLKEIAKRNVKMQIVTEPKVMEHKEINSEIFGTFRLFQKNVDLKFSESPITVELMIFDRQTIFISIKNVKNINRMCWLFTNNQVIKELATNYFDAMWQKAKVTNILKNL